MVRAAKAMVTATNRATARKRAMTKAARVMAPETRVAGGKEGDDKGGKGNGNGDKEGNVYSKNAGNGNDKEGDWQQRGQWEKTAIN
jgi:hypothetical protein